MVRKAIRKRATLRKDVHEAEAGLPEARSDGDVPGPSPDPATNLIMADIAMRAGSYVLRDVVERTMLKGSYSDGTARKIIQNRSLKQTVASVAIAKFATRSVPGAAIVGGGILVKALFDKSQQRRARLRGRKKLAEQAQEES
ncbi:hypothetical protein [Erythrobacter litoralis]|uniref:Uncharacterized protein n=1 Tax=Erythrobacter litoralis (strain HTCC2594) TaxID=314225 RepID=Q2N8I3_ERYLH|nr:hypothetical protein [Erythrobacter litoralis]ABC64008.1 hypothetical protein ELI_09580 [Erythrobacter litoralis HTCC2594]